MPKSTGLALCFFALTLLVLGLAACEPEPDPCIVDETPLYPHAKSCAKGDLVVLGKFSGTSEDVTGEHATSHRQVVLDDTYAYWSDYHGSILRTPKVGGATEVLLEPSECSVAALAVDEVGVYFGHNCPESDLASQTSFPIVGKVAWLDKATRTRHELAQHILAEVTQIAVQDGTVYWVVSNPDVFSEASSLHAAPRDASISGDDTLLRSAAVSMFFALTGPNIVWFNATVDELRVSSLNGGFGDHLVSAPDAESLFVHGDTAYWLQRTIDMNAQSIWHLWQVPTGGGQTSLAFDQLANEHMITDGSSFFGAGYESGVYRVYRWSPPLFEPERLAAGLADPQSTALDEHYLFVVDRHWEEHLEVALLRIER